MAQQWNALLTKDEDHAAAATQGIENQAYYEAQEPAAAYDYMQESLTDVITQTRDLRARDSERHGAREGCAAASRRSAQAARRAGHQDRPDQEQARQRAGPLKDPRRQEGSADREVPGAPQVDDHGR